MFLTFHVLLDLDVEDRMVARHLRLSMLLHAGAAEQLDAVETLRRRVAMLVAHHLADVAERVLGRRLLADDLDETGDEEVVRQLLDAADRKLGPLAAERTGELAVVGVLLVARLGGDVVLDALFAERVETRETLRALVALETDLADEKLVVDLLRELAAAAGTRGADVGSVAAVTGGARGATLYVARCIS